MNVTPVVVTPNWPVQAHAASRLADRPEAAEDATNLVLTAMLMLARRAGGGERSHPLMPDEPVRSGAQLGGRTLGLVGSGAVAWEVARRAHHGFGMRVLVHSPSPNEADDSGTPDVMRCASLEDLLSEADFVALLGTGEGDGGTIDARRLDQMKPSAFLVDTVGGGSIDHQALMHALWFETIEGVALCVDPDQPEQAADLAACPNALMLTRQH